MDSAPAPEAQPLPNPAAAIDERFRCGTLYYTKAALFVLFGWLLWGDFCFTIFENLGGPGILGLYLQDNFHVSNTQLYILFSLVPHTLGMILTPVISFKSDRFRSRLGRRIPFMLFTMPFLCLCAAAIGFTDDIISYLKTHLGPDSFISPVTASLLVVGFMVAGFTFFNEFVNTVYWYLFADVVPPKFIGRFNSLFRIVASAAGFLIGNFVAGYSLTHIKVIHVSAAVLYFVGFGLMCWRVKEGEYPPVTDVTAKTTVTEQVKIYFRECFVHPIFIWFYVASAMWVIARAAPGSAVFGLHLGQHKEAVAAYAPAESASAELDPQTHAFRCRNHGLANGDRVTLKPAGSSKFPEPFSQSKTYYVVQKDAEAFKLSTAPDGEAIEIKKAGRAAFARAMRAVTAMSPDGQCLVSGGGDGRIKFYARTGKSGPKLARTAGGENGPVLCLAVSPDGSLAVSGLANGMVETWITATGERLWSAQEHAGEVRAIAFSADGTRLASAGADKLVRLWDPKTGHCVQTLSGHTDAVNSVAFSSTGERVVSGGSDRKILVWEAAQGRILKTLEGSPGPVYAVCYAPALEKRPVVAPEDFRARTLGVVTGYFKDVFSADSLFNAPPDQKSRITGEDRWIVAGGRDGKTDDEFTLLRVYDAETGGVALSRRFANAEDEKAGRADPVQSGLKGHKATITAVQYKADIRKILSGSMDGSVRLWDPVELSMIATDQSFISYSGYTSGVTSFACEARGKLMVNASDQGKLHVWDLDEGISLRKGGVRGSFFMLLSILLAYSFGALADRFNPIWITLWTTTLLVPIQAAGFFFMKDYMSSTWIECFKMPVFAIQAAAQMPFMIMLLPKTKFGQFCSANGMVRAVVAMASGIGGALFMDWVTNFSLDTDAFRYGMLWVSGGTLLNAIALWIVFWHWKKLGGQKYVPPEN